MLELVDQLNRKVFLASYPPNRIVSLVPSQTELLHDLGLEEEVVGITKFCVHPQDWFRTKTRVGGTKQVNIEKVRLLQPDLILANKEENVKEQIVELEKIAPVWISDVNNLDDALLMIESVGIITRKSPKAKQLTETIRYSFSKLETSDLKLATCYLIWRNPYMTIGGDTFIGDMLKRCGLQNVYEQERRYPEITLEQLKERKVQLLLLSSEPFPFKQKHAEEMKAILPGTKILMVDGEMFSWYGSRLLYAVQYFNELVNKIYDPVKPSNDIA